MKISHPENKFCFLNVAEVLFDADSLHALLGEHGQSHVFLALQYLQRKYYGWERKV